MSTEDIHRRIFYRYPSQIFLAVAKAAAAAVAAVVAAAAAATAAAAAAVAAARPAPQPALQRPLQHRRRAFLARTKIEIFRINQRFLSFFSRFRTFSDVFGAFWKVLDIGEGTGRRGYR